MNKQWRYHPTWSDIRAEFMSILDPIDASCLTCYYFKNSSDPDDATSRGLCRHHAPGPTGWPVVTENDYCGDWRTDYRPLTR